MCQRFSSLSDSIAASKQFQILSGESKQRLLNFLMFLHKRYTLLHSGSAIPSIFKKNLETPFSCWFAEAVVLNWTGGVFPCARTGQMDHSSLLLVINGEQLPLARKVKQHMSHQPPFNVFLQTVTQPLRLNGLVQIFSPFHYTPQFE